MDQAIWLALCAATGFLLDFRMSAVFGPAQAVQTELQRMLARKFLSLSEQDRERVNSSDLQSRYRTASA